MVLWRAHIENASANCSIGGLTEVGVHAQES